LVYFEKICARKQGIKVPTIFSHFYETNGPKKVLFREQALN
jgi:hypothetical protein